MYMAPMQPGLISVYNKSVEKVGLTLKESGFRSDGGKRKEI